MGSSKRTTKSGKKQGLNSFLSLSLFLFLSFTFQVKSLSNNLNPPDTLQTLSKNYDVTYYELEVTIEQPEYIKGKNTIHLNLINSTQDIQIDLSHYLKVDSIVKDGHKLVFRRDSNLILVDPKPFQNSTASVFTIYYSGKPIIAKNPPWEGGLVWTLDSLSRPWWAVACEDDGSGIWWPSNALWNDEPDSMKLDFIIPRNLYCVSNGRLESIEPLSNQLTKYSWKVSNPINTYNATFYIGHYKHFSDTLATNGKPLTLDYYPIDFNYSSARKHFTQVKKILTVFQDLFGPYPFPTDGYKLVEAPYWGMEHQSAVAYGNHYKNDMPGYDFIIVHETAHEWWGNSITATDPGDMWIHEAFATYSEALLLEKTFGYNTSTKYLLMQRLLIKNKYPVAGPLNINYHDYIDTDMYYKGTWMLHTLRSIINDDQKWFGILKELGTQFKHQLVSHKDIVDYFSKASGQNLESFFKQYLDYPEIPTLEIKTQKQHKSTILEYQLISKSNLNIPIEIILNEKERLILHTSSAKQTLSLEKKISKISLDQSKYLINLSLMK